MAKGHDDSAGQGRKVNDRVGLDLLRGVAQAVAENQATLGVGVDHLDCLAVHGRHDVTGLGGVVGGHVFRGDDDAMHLDVHVQVGECMKHTHDSSAARHVKLHLIHAGARLQADATRVKGQALAKDADAPGGLLLRLVDHVHKLRLFRRAFGNGEQ